MGAFAVMLREGTEAALVVAILTAYLQRIGRPEETRWVWLGTAVAVAVSVGVGVVLYVTIGGLEGTAEAVTEGTIALFAAAVLTWMVFWMGRQARAIKGKLHSQVDSALVVGSAGALAAVAFFAVVREGLESALFLISTTVGAEASGGQFFGGLLGVAAAVAIGYLVHRGGTRINLRVFFRATGALIILFAAGLVATGIHEFQEAGFLPVFAEHLWQLDFADPDTNLGWRFMRSLFGWRSDPSLLMLLGYIGYLVPAGLAFLKATAAPAERVAEVPTGA